MNKRVVALGVLPSVLLLVSCASSSVKISEQRELAAAPEKDKYGFSRDLDRKNAIAKAQVFLEQPEELGIEFMPADPSQADIVRGPHEGLTDTFEPEEEVTCKFEEAGNEMNGQTPKFRCGRDLEVDGETIHDSFKVKFGKNNGEVRGEILSTRLFWALGFPADRMYPVVLKCENCPVDPQIRASGNPSTRLIENTVIERHFGLKKMTKLGDPEQGWTWKELENINQDTKAHRDALRLLGAFIQHSDSKREQQRLVCPKKKIVTLAGHQECLESGMLVQDLGTSFGGTGGFMGKGEKANLKAWSHTPLWKDPAHCIAKISRHATATDGLADPKISEEGWQFLVQRMQMLRREQIQNLFKIARFNDEEVERWTTAFLAKVEQMAHPLGAGKPEFRCPD